VTDLKSVPFGGAGSNPANVSFCSRSSVGRSSASHAEGPGFDPLRELVCWLFSRKVERSIRPENCFLIRYGVVGNMSGSHPVASGSIPGIGFFLCSLSSVGRASA
jgi:hypothetical protein